MAQKNKRRIINLFITPSAFASIFKRLKGDRSEYDFSELSELRNLLSNEKSKILNYIKEAKPSSIYQISNVLQRDFKSVREDIKLLEKFGFIELVEEKVGNRRRLKPIINIDSLQINISFQ